MSSLSTPSDRIVSALLVGKRSSIKAEVPTDTRNSGLAHLLAISGLHLSLVSSFFLILVTNILALSPTLTLSHEIQKLAAFLSILISTFYLLIAGTPISAQRAFIMILIMLSVIILDKTTQCVAFYNNGGDYMLLIQPKAILTPSFQMSFMAVIAICSFYTHLKFKPHCAVE